MLAPTQPPTSSSFFCSLTPFASSARQLVGLNTIPFLSPDEGTEPFYCSWLLEIQLVSRSELPRSESGTQHTSFLTLVFLTEEDACTDMLSSACVHILIIQSVLKLKDASPDASLIIGVFNGERQIRWEMKGGVYTAKGMSRSTAAALDARDEAQFARATIYKQMCAEEELMNRQITCKNMHNKITS